MLNVGRGTAFYNQGRFFEAREAWEHEWLAAPEGAERQFIRGLIMLASALHKLTRGEYMGSLMLLARCNAAFDALPLEFESGIDLDALKGEVRAFYRKFGDSSTCVWEEDYPRIREREAMTAA